MATITGKFANNSKNTYPWIDYTYTQNIGNNTTTITAKLYVKKVNSYGQSWQNSCSCNIKIDGTTAWSGTIKFDIRNIAVGSSQHIGTATRTITHNADGTRSCSISGYVGATGTSLGAGNVSGTPGLPTIPRKTNVTLSGSNKINSDMIINHKGASSSFRYNIYYYFGNASGTIGTNKSGNSTTWKIPVALQNQIPNSTSGTLRIVLKTLSGGSEIGSSETTKTIYVADDCYPSWPTAVFTDASTKPAGVTGFYQNYSKLRATISASGTYGSRITKYEVQYNAQWYSSSSSAIVTAVMATSGLQDVRIKITDSRGRSREDYLTDEIDVKPYSSPRITDFTYKRTKMEDGKEEESNLGNIGYFSASGVFGSNAGASSRRFKYRTKASSSWTTVSLANQNYTNYKFATTLSTADAYILRFEMTDALQTIFREIEMTNVFPLISMNPQGNGIAFGKEATVQNRMDINIPLRFEKDPMITDSVDILLSNTQSNPRIGYESSTTDVYISNYDNNWLRLKKDRQMTYAGYKVYTAYEKPTPGEIGALTAPVAVSRNTNLNSLTTPGMYYNPSNADVATMTNAPVDYAFSLLVERHAGWKQTFSTYSTSHTEHRVYIRNYYNGTWTPWVEMFTARRRPGSVTLWTGSIHSGSGGVTLTNGRLYSAIVLRARVTGSADVFTTLPVNTFSTSVLYYQMTTETGYLKFATRYDGNNIIISWNSGSSGSKINAIFGI